MLRRMAACGAAAAALLALTTGCGEQDQRAGATATATTGAPTSQAKAALAKRADAAQVAENELNSASGPRARCRPAGGGWDAECRWYDPLERRRMKFGVLVTNSKLGETSGVVPVRAPLPRTNAELRLAHQRWVLRTNATCGRKNEDLERAESSGDIATVVREIRAVAAQHRSRLAADPPPRPEDRPFFNRILRLMARDDVTAMRLRRAISRGDRAAAQRYFRQLQRHSKAANLLFSRLGICLRERGGGSP